MHPLYWVNILYVLIRLIRYGSYFLNHTTILSMSVKLNAIIDYDLSLIHI